MYDVLGKIAQQLEQTRHLIAIALKYKRREFAPKIVAKGYNEMAKKIELMAAQSDVQVREDCNLIAFIESVEVDDYIPYEPYGAVAEILRFIATKQVR